MAKIIDNIKDLILADGDDYLIYVNDDIKVQYNLASDANIIYFFQNQKDITFIDEGIVKSGASVNITYLDLSNYNIEFKSSLDVYEHSNLNITLKALGAKHKNYIMNYQNLAYDSNIKIDNSVVCLKDAKVLLSCTGKIVKGAKRSSNHQSSRCLNIDKKVNAIVEPILLIDENDVLASHALSSGTIDEDILFYLKSRGIDNKQASILFIHSYLMLNEEILEGFDNKEDIIAQIESQVDKLYA